MVKAGDSEGKKGEGGRRGGGRGGLTWSSFIDDINMDSSIVEVFLNSVSILGTVKPLPLDTLYLWKLEVFGIQMKKYPFLVSIGRSKNLPLFRENFRFLA